MARPTWPPRYVNVPIPALRENDLPHGAFRFYCKLRALAWGEATLVIPFEKLLRETGLSQSRVYEYARLCRDHIGLPFHCAAGVFECSFPDLPDIPEKQESPSPSLPKSSSNKSKGERRSRKAGIDESAAPPAVGVFRSVVERFPNKATWPQIASAVGETPAGLERWRITIQGWILAGHFELNVGGMLDWYSRGQTSKGGPATPPKSNGNGAAATKFSTELTPAQRQAQEQLRAQVKQHKEAQRAKNQ